MMPTALPRHRGMQFLLVLIVGGVLSWHAGLDNNWDLRNYHVYGPYALLTGRLGIDINAAGTQTSFNPILDIPYFLLAFQWLSGMPRLVAFLAGLPYGVLIWMVLGLARRLLGGASPWAALTATAIGVTGTTVISEIGQSFGDIPIAILLLGALWIALRGAEGSRPGLPNIGAGLLLGAACGLKLTACVFAPGLAIGAIVTASTWRARGIGCAAICAGWAVGFAATYGYWGLHLWHAFANPLFPMANNLFGSDWATADSGRDLRFLPKTALQAIFYPLWWLSNRANVVSETTIRDWHFALAFPAALYLALRRPRESATRLLLCFTICGYVLWESLFSIIRYAIPLEALTGIVMMMALRPLLAPRRWLLTGAAVLVFLLSTSAWSGWGRVRVYDGVALAPDLPVLPDGTVVAVASKPVSFVLPFLRGRNLAFVGVMDVAPGTRMQAAIAQRLARAAHIVALLRLDDPDARVFAKAVGLAIDVAGCETLRTGREPSDVALCPAGN